MSAIAASTRPRPSLRMPLFPTTVATGLVVLLIGGGVLGGSLAVGDSMVPGTSGERAGLSGADGFADVFLRILSINVPVVASLVSGIVTAGLTTAVTGLLLGVYLGVTMTAAANTVGASALLDSVGAYVGLEMLGLALAAVAGLVPVATAVVGARGVPQGSETPGAVRRYAKSLPSAAVMIVASLSLVVVGAAIEANVISASA